MKGYSAKFMKKLRKYLAKRWWVVCVVILGIMILVGGSLRIWYGNNLSAVNSSDKSTVYYTVESGASLHQISLGLKKAGLIRNTSVFEYYVRTHELYGSLQAGSYAFNKSMGAQQIVRKITHGEISTNLVTVLPGKRLDQIRKNFESAGYTKAQIDAAFDPATYGGLPALSSLPAGATLEGYMYPDSFQKDGATPASAIVKQSLNELDKYLTAEVIDGCRAQNLNIYQCITLASIVYQESGDPKYESTVAQVFLTRLKQGMNLGSDVTAFYGSALAGVTPSVAYDTAFNTRLHPGLTPGPISNFTADALQAVAHPANSDYLYFVAGDDGVIHFSHTQAEHDAAVAKYCTKECQ